MTASAIAEFLAAPKLSAYPRSVTASVPVGPRAFGLRCVGDSMTKPGDPRSIPDGCTVIVDPDRQWQEGNRVVVSKRSFDVVTVKEIHTDGARIILRPLNPAYPLMELTDEMAVLGVVVQTIINEEDVMSACLRPDQRAIPDRATCIDMLDEISAEAYAAPHWHPAPELTVRYESVMHWLRHGKAIPAKKVAALRCKPELAANIGMLGRRPRPPISHNNWR